jgi:hypothetical protein
MSEMQKRINLGDIWINENSEGNWARWEIVGEPERLAPSWNEPSVIRCLAKLLEKQWDDDKKVGRIYSIRLQPDRWRYEEWDLCADCDGRAPEGDYLCKGCRLASMMPESLRP